MNRPYFVICVARAHANHVDESWCGRRIAAEFHFLGFDHAAENGLQQGRHVACPECVEAATKALRNGQQNVA